MGYNGKKGFKSKYKNFTTTRTNLNQSLMRFHPRKLSLFKKIVIFGTLFFFLITVGLILIANFYNSVLNIPLGQRFAQINTGHGSINIFIPKDDTTWFYFHNFSFPQVITSSNTKMEGLKVNPLEENSNQKIPTSNKNKAMQTSVSTPKPSSPRYIKSKILNLTFTTPNGVETSYYPHIRNNLSEGNEIIEYKMGYMMRISITANYKCEDTTSSSYQEPKTILLASEIPLIFPNNRMGFRHGIVKLNARKYISSKNVCIDVDQEITASGNEERVFDQILSSAYSE